MTRRERLERKLERRGEWADKANARSAAAFDSAGQMCDNERVADEQKEQERQVS